MDPRDFDFDPESPEEAMAMIMAMMYQEAMTSYAAHIGEVTEVTAEVDPKYGVAWLKLIAPLEKGDNCALALGLSAKDFWHDLDPASEPVKRANQAAHSLMVNALAALVAINDLAHQHAAAEARNKGQGDD